MGACFETDVSADPGRWLPVLLLRWNPHEGEHAAKLGLLDPLPVVLDLNPPIRLDFRPNNARNSIEHFGGFFCLLGTRNRGGRPRRVPELLTKPSPGRQDHFAQAVSADLFRIEVDTQSCRLPECLCNQMRSQYPISFSDAREKAVNAGILVFWNAGKYVWEVNLHDRRHCLS
jgi:hypothetical protein